MIEKKKTNKRCNEESIKKCNMKESKTIKNKLKKIKNKTHKINKIKPRA